MVFNVKNIWKGKALLVFVFGMSHNILRKRNRWKEESAPKAWCLKSVWAELFYQIFLAASYFRLWGAVHRFPAKCSGDEIFFWYFSFGGQKKSMLSLQGCTELAEKPKLRAAGLVTASNNWSRERIKSFQIIIILVCFPQQRSELLVAICI